MLNQTEHRSRATGSARAAACAVGLLIWVAGTATPTSTASSSPEETYRWTGELVALDEGAGTLAVKARVLSPAVLEQSDGLRPGDSIVVTWSGSGDRASGIWSLARSAAATAGEEPEPEGTDERFPLRATFEALDADNRYLTFRVPLPEASRSTVRALTRGAWARMTSPRHLEDARAALLAVDPYVPSRDRRAPVARGATYRWDGELRMLDDAAGALTVRAQMVSTEARSAAAGLTAGEAIVITWSGYGDEASGIRTVMADDGSGLWGSDRYLLRATFEGVEAGGRQLAFRVPLPEASRVAVRWLTQGAWARMTSPHHPADAQPPLLAVNAYVPARQAPPALLAQDATYRWGGELVALDEAADVLTVRAQMVSAEARSGAAGLTAGEAIVITWSGYGDEASGVRAVMADDGSGLWGSDRYLLRATFEAAEAGGRQLTFRVPLPAGSRSAVRSLTRGAWALMTSPHHPADAGPALMAINSYAPSRQPLPAALAQDATYRWGGELMALDEASDALTVRAQMVSAEARSGAAGLTAGEAIVIAWSGYGDEASGIRAVMADDGSGLWGSDRYLLRATFAATEAGGRQLAFRVPLPEGNRSTVRSLTRGAWALMTSPHHPADAGPALMAINSYAPSRQPLAALAQDATYRWGGELVALDEASDALTVRAQMVSAEARSGAAGLTAGEAIVIAWSGYGDEASGIRAVMADDGSGLWGSDRYLLRATFAATEAGGRQLAFRVPLPEDSRSAVRSLTRGAWALMTSPHHPADARPALLAVNAYVPSRQPVPVALGQDATYRWDGELVALDPTAGALTVRAQIVSTEAGAAASGLTAGQPIVITWSGHEHEASGIRAVAADDGSGLWGSDRYLLRATFEAVAADGRQLTFRVPLPQDDQDAVQELTEGASVRVTSPHHPADAGPALLAVNAHAPAPETPVAAAAGGETAYVWPGRLISLHGAEQAVTVSAPAEQHVFRYVERFGKGDAVVLLWAPGDGHEVTAVRYLQHREAEDQGQFALDHGYVLPAEFIAADGDSRRITFKAQVPASTFDALAGIQPGQMVKVTSPFDQRGLDGAAILAVERDDAHDAQAQE